MAKAYLGIGAILAVTMWSSYLLGAMFTPSARFSFGQRVGVSFKIHTVPSLLHAVWWGPSLAIWMVAPQGQSFGKWLAPGFYTEGFYGDSLP
jgi:hypothetical protein